MFSATFTDSRAVSLPGRSASPSLPFGVPTFSTANCRNQCGANTWTLLRGLEAFLEAWQHGDEPPALVEFLPSGPREARREALVQFLMADLDFRYRRGCPKRTEEYAQEFPDLADGDGIPCELIFEEHQIRSAHGENVDPEEYYRRFPQQAEELQRWLALASPAATTVGGVKRVLDVQEGDALDDFQLLSLLGEGAFGRVFLARQTSMHRLVALKVSADRGAEPQTLAQLDHPNIVRVYDQRRLADRGVRLLYMQYVAGGTLQDVVRRVCSTPPDERRGALLLEAVDEAVERGGQPAMSDNAERRRLAAAAWPAVVCRLGAQLAQALEYAHQEGVLHRDVKPANVLLAADGSPKLADFNTSASSQLEDTPAAAYFGGSLAYMSPEQLEACHPGLPTKPDDLDARCDIYSLGIVLWELLHGGRPFHDAMSEEGWEATVEAMIAARRAGPPASPADDKDSLLTVLEGVLRRCLAPNRDDRFATGQQLARELRLCLNARAREILQASPRGWRRWAQHHPVLAGMVVGNGSHTIASVFAVVYIHFAIIQGMTPAQQAQWYCFIAVAFVAAMGHGSWEVRRLGRRVTATLASPLGQAHDRQQLAAVRRESLQLARKAVPFGLGAWVVAGFFLASLLTWITGRLRPGDCVNILLANLVCACIGVVYPVLFGALIATRANYPALIARTRGEPDDGPELQRLADYIDLVLPFAGAIPIIALSPIALFKDGMAITPRVIAVGFVVVASFIALPLAWRMSRGIKADLAALALIQSNANEEA